MSENISKVQRWLDLIAYLVGRRFPVPVDELMERLPAYAQDWRAGDKTARESVRRRFERDKSELRGLGIPLDTVTYHINFGAEEVQGYRIAQSDFYLPYLKLLEEEGDLFNVAPDGSIEIPSELASDAVWGLKELGDLPAFPMASAARGALRKFTFDLDPSVVGEGTTPLDPSKKHVYFAIPPETAGTKNQLEALSDALLRRKTVAFTYHGIERNQETQREVRPFGLLFKHSHWYLVGWDETRDAERIFRVDRMEKVKVNPSAPATPDFEMPAQPVLERYRDREAWELGEAEETMEALVRFRFPASLWADRNNYGEKVGETDDGGATRRFEVRQPEAFVRWILSQEGDAYIQSPPSLQDAFQTLAKQVADLYKGDADA